jgi:hypothetical protein
MIHPCPMYSGLMFFCIVIPTYLGNLQFAALLGPHLLHWVSMGIALIDKTGKT